MILRRLAEHVRAQNWFAVALDFVIVVLGVFIGVQLGNWNEAREEEKRREQIVDALETNLADLSGVQARIIAETGQGLDDWRAAYERGERPPPFSFRFEGSDTAPDVWSTFQQMDLTDLFDAVTLFDLMFFYSEHEGVGRKYVRYVTFVESEVLPRLIDGADGLGGLGGLGGFYDESGRLRPEFQANMDRLRDYQQDVVRLQSWSDCLVYRLRAGGTFPETCLRAEFRLPGMEAGRGAGEQP